MQCVELRLKTIEAVGFIRDFLLGNIELRLDFLECWIGIDIRGVVGDKLSSYADEVSSEVDDSISFLDEAFVVANCDGLALVNAGLFVLKVDAKAKVAVLLQGVVGRVEVATIDIDGDGVFDAIRIKGAASDGPCGCVVIAEVSDRLRVVNTDEVTVSRVAPSFRSCEVLTRHIVELEGKAGEIVTG